MINSKSDVQPEKKKSKSGLIITLSILGVMAIAMTFGALYYNYRKDKEKTYISNPKVGDVYEIEMRSGNFSTAKVLQVTQDSVYTTENNLETDQLKGISEIDIDRNYGILKNAHSRKEIERLFMQDTIFAINRN
ncbi:hypothetical protein [Flavobacterium sp. 102]|uniref:hypothetical protein n=1 Tax=Flavobacterium sp. 102 TaxID=2135623 RepID=UPI000EB4FAF4|nr:hypothetical protein [Flavobacterium sp. 102]RKS02733.1 hypothetical protein C8C84_2462 [Flavobacterium sp. 102]